MKSAYTMVSPPQHWVQNMETWPRTRRCAVTWPATPLEPKHTQLCPHTLPCLIALEQVGTYISYFILTRWPAFPLLFLIWALQIYVKLISRNYKNCTYNNDMNNFVTIHYWLLLITFTIQHFDFNEALDLWYGFLGAQTSTECSSNIRQ